MGILETKPGSYQPNLHILVLNDNLQPFFLVAKEIFSSNQRNNLLSAEGHVKVGTMNLEWKELIHGTHFPATLCFSLYYFLLFETFEHILSPGNLFTAAYP